MPRLRRPQTRSDHVMTPEEYMEKIEEMENNPYKDKLKATFKEFLEQGRAERAKLEDAMTNEVAEIEGMFNVMVQKIPQHHLNMNFKEYVAMTDAESRAAVRPSFLRELDQICDLQTARIFPESKKADGPADDIKCVTSPRKQNQKKKKKAKAAATSSAAIGSSCLSNGGQLTTTMASSALAPKGQSSRSQRNITPTAQTATACKYTGGFTPKFDPRLPITPAQGLRKLNLGEKIVLMSQSGSPLTHQVTEDNSGPAVIYSLEDGRTIAISSETQLSNLQLDEETRATLRKIQQNLAAIINKP